VGRVATHSLLRYNKRKKTTNKIVLPFRITPREDESLYSYVIRVVLAFGISPGSFVRSYLPEIRRNVGEVDFDVFISESLIKVFSYRFRIDYETLYKTSLRSLTGTLFESPNPKTTTPFIDALKEVNTFFTGFGYKVCPLCIEESLKNIEKRAIIKSPHLKKFWRVSFYLVCPEHQLLLIDRCPECGASINLHKGYLQEFFGVCFRCGLSFTKFPQISCRSYPEVLEMFFTLYGVLQEGKGTLNYLNNGRPIKAVIYFGFLRNLVRVTQRLMRIHKHYLVKLLKEEEVFDVAEEYCRKLSVKKDLKSLVFKNYKKFEYLPVEEKLIILKICFDIFKNFKEFVEVYKKELHLTREILYKDWYKKLSFLLTFLE